MVVEGRTPLASAEAASPRVSTPPVRRRWSFAWALISLVVLGLLLRVAILVSPLGELDGDEAVVGLMARHIAFEGERPVFYWGQPYLGSLEAFTAAPLFKVFDSSTLLLKLVPTAYGLGFLVLSVLLARRLFGTGPALATGAYLALPPAMWGVWSTKARGGYAELLFLGEALLLVTLWWAERARPNDGRGPLLWGLLAGLSIWTHLLAVVYVLPSLVYLGLRRQLRPRPVGVGVVGMLVGMLPVLIDNLVGGFQTLQALLQPPDLPLDPLAQFERFFRVGLPVLAGLGQPTTSAAMFDSDWGNRPAGHLSVAVAFLVLLGLALAVHRSALVALVRPRSTRHSPEPGLLLLVAVCVPPVVAFTRFGFFVSEPRYALPLYAVVPLVMAAVWKLKPSLRLGTLAAVLGLNLLSLITTDVRLWRPEDAADSTAATRADLVRYLVSQDRHQVYTDYWIAYPVMFETHESVLAYIISGGFNRYLPPADNVQRTPNAAWAFERNASDPEPEAEFTSDLQAAGGRARVAEVSVYRVYTDVEPIDAVRPPR